MEQYISKSALIAEIDKRLYQLTDAAFDSRIGRNLIEIKDFLDTLEVKEVDLDNDVDKILEENDWDYDEIDFYDFAKHFFELGMSVSNKAQKGE